MNKKIRVKITVGQTELSADMEDNATTQWLVNQMPMTVHMQDLYNREMCHRYGAYALPTDNMRSDGYAVGDIAYWAPGGSLVILYAQNGEHFERQHLGHIDSGVEVFQHTGDADVRFEIAE
ncbi:cyclophilin-like fold protein [Alloscardovia criceti]|uniref:cyclophilin-like fold protein n=1 Tax=Alloscardovia criceti TaxID=356828 RepID=UPI00036128EA|nr:cyclophilin-like fold protein [Alloscardovia criceti]